MSSFSKFNRNSPLYAIDELPSMKSAETANKLHIRLNISRVGWLLPLSHAAIEGALISRIDASSRVESLYEVLNNLIRSLKETIITSLQYFTDL